MAFCSYPGRRSWPSIPGLRVTQVIDRKRKYIDTFHMGITACCKDKQNTYLDFKGKVHFVLIHVLCSQSCLIVIMCVCVCVCVCVCDKTADYHNKIQITCCWSKSSLDMSLFSFHWSSYWIFDSRQRGSYFSNGFFFQSLHRKLLISESVDNYLQSVHEDCRSYYFKGNFVKVKLTQLLICL